MKTNIIPPPVLAIGMGFAIWWFKDSVPSLAGDGEWLSLAGKLLILFAIGIDLWALVTFSKANTSVDPLNPDKASALVCHGPFAFSRNPMYVGLALMLSGWGLIQNSWFVVPIVFIFVIYMTMMQIKPEEKVLTEKFGDAFTHYQSRVRRWI